MNAWLEENGVGAAKVSYRLRDWLFSRQRYWGEPIPVIHWEDGTMTTVPESELPLVLPKQIKSVLVVLGNLHWLQLKTGFMSQTQ